MKIKLMNVLFLVGSLLTCNLAFAEDNTVTIRINNHKFIPSEITVPSQKKIKLIIINEDPTPEEFESYDLNREKIVPGNGKIVVIVGPLKPGQYKFFGEFNEKTAQGLLIVN